MINYSIAIMGTKPGTRKAQITETKAYGIAQCSEVIDINQFAKHISDHGCVYGKGDIVGVLTMAVSCLKELMLEGHRVKLGDLGDFQPDVVLYEEGLDNDTVRGAVHAIAEADVLIIAGTSLTVYPAAGLVQYFGGSKLVLINRDPTPMDNTADLVLHDKVGQVLSKIKL